MPLLDIGNGLIKDGLTVPRRRRMIKAFNRLENQLIREKKENNPRHLARITEQLKILQRKLSYSIPQKDLKIYL